MVDKLNQRIAEVEKEIEDLSKCSTKALNWNEIHTDILKLKAELKGLKLGKQAVEELEQMYKVRNDDAKDYAKVITELQEERKELLEKIKIKVLINWKGQNEFVDFLEQLNTQTEEK